MQVALYNIFIALYVAAAKLVAFFKPKAKQLIDGRKGLLKKMKGDFKAEDKKNIIWFHCASLGEFEQGRPLMEALKQKHPEIKILLTFFSPSGYEVRKSYAGVDFVYYLPFDTASNAQSFIEITKPVLAIFVKYELWYHYLKTLQERKVPAILISAIFQDRHAFFKWYGGLQRKMLHSLNHIFVQNEASKKRLEQIGISAVSIAGDTRIDRAIAIAHTAKAYPDIEAFKGDAALIVAGSTWTEDESLLQASMKRLADRNIKLLIAPHEIHEAHIQQILNKFESFGVALLSGINSATHAKVLVVDNIGHLAFLYRYADYVWIGGGFNKTGIHNSIEAAVYNKAMCWGPRYDRYQEAIDLIVAGVAVSCNDSLAFIEQINFWQSQPAKKYNAERAAQHYITSNQGATVKILDYLKLQRIF